MMIWRKTSGTEVEEEKKEKYFGNKNGGDASCIQSDGFYKMDYLKSFSHNISLSLTSRFCPSVPLLSLPQFNKFVLDRE